MSTLVKEIADKASVGCDPEEKELIKYALSMCGKTDDLIVTKPSRGNIRFEKILDTIDDLSFEVTSEILAMNSWQISNPPKTDMLVARYGELTRIRAILYSSITLAGHHHHAR